ncbi:MAG: TolC family protein [Fuerstiella sp.]
MQTQAKRNDFSVTRRRVNATAFVVCGILPAMLLSGCASTRCAPGRSQVNSEMTARALAGLSPNQCGECSIPNDVLLDDGVTADEAVAVSLWNNSAFNATLAQLGIARGDLVQAGMLKNPQLSLLLPGGTKQLEWTLYIPIEALLLRETRLDMSEREVRRVADELVQNGLNLVRDARVAHADLVFAVERANLANEAVGVRQRIADLTQKQLNAGDISELEATTARIDFLRAQSDAAGIRHAVAQAEARLKQLMGIGTWSMSLQPVATNVSHSASHLDLERLISEATCNRPDLKAAAFALEAAKHRAELANWQWLRFDMIADANAGGAGNTNFGPGFRFDVPIFDRNQGGIQSANWSVNQALQNYNAVSDQVVADVQTAFSQTQQAADSLSLLRSEVLTALQEAVQLAEHAYTDGGAPYFLVLQTTSQYLDARTQELQLEADLQKAHANLDRGVGRKLPSNEFPTENRVEQQMPISSIINPDAQASRVAAEIDEGLSEKLRRITDQLDTMNLEAKRNDGPQTSPVSFGGAISTGWQQ